MPHPVSASVLRSIASQALSEDPDTRLIAVSSAPLWEGSPKVEVDDGEMSVYPCVSSLAVREVVADVLADGESRAFILTDLEQVELGHEVLARLWRHRIHRPHGWDALRELFRATDMDPALGDQRWLVDALVDVAPVGGYPPPKSGLLDLDTAWATYLRHGLRIQVERPGLEDLLRWGEQESSRALVSGRVKPHLDRIADRIGGSEGAAARHLFRLVAAGRGSELVPMGLVCGVLWSDALAEDQPLITARVRFEGPLGGRGLTAEAARAWGRAAEALVQRAHTLSDEATRTRWVNQAEAVLGGELEGHPFAHASDVLPRGFEQRMEQAGRTLLDMLQRRSDGTAADLRRAVERASKHLRTKAIIEGERVERLRMAERIVRRWGKAEEEEIGDLAGAARRYVGDGAWVDRAREAVGHGETVEPLTDAYARILTRLDDERQERDRRFARELANWSSMEPGDRPPLLPVERVLDRVVVPTARQAPVLLLVLDGWSQALSSRLFADLAERGWARLGPLEGEHPVVVSALPSVTSVSRASLLTGRLSQGGQNVERAGWEEHAGLREVSRKRPAPLFHRADLSGADTRETGPVRGAILDPNVRVVGVVVNAIDEHLDKGGQLRLAEGLQALRPVTPLLDAAMEAGRIVILASDHGHVLETGSRVALHGGASERWRPNHPPAGDDEVELKGPRVLTDGGSIVVPATERLRYISAKKHGYHGGATPQEVLCPLAILTPPGATLDGWGELPPLEPWWWREEGRPLERAVRPAAAPPPVKVEPEVDEKGQVQLFGTGEPASGEETASGPEGADRPWWLNGLFASPILDTQREAAGRQSLSDEDIAAFLLLLEEAGGVVGLNVLAHHLEVPPTRVSSKAAALRRMLNVDGFSVIELEGDGTMRFQRDVLIRQFRLDA